MSEYKPEAEGALYSRRKSVPMTEESLRNLVEQFQLAQTAECVSTAEQNALAILREHFHPEAELSERLGVVVDGKRVCPGLDATELVRDAFNVIDCALRVRKLHAVIESDPVAKVPKLICELITRCTQLGIGHERLLMRYIGIETAVAGRKKSDSKLAKGGKPKFTNAELQRYIDRAKERFPGADKTIVINEAERISKMICPDGKGVSARTFWRREKKLIF